MFTSTATLLALAATASAHFTLLYPEWRGSSFKSPASQWTYPCAGVNSSDTSPRTLWPLTGGAVVYNNSHDQVYAFFNIGVGNNAVNLNYTLSEGLLNVTGAGVLCLPNLSLPSSLNVTEGTNATIQVINLAHSGAALYNCADITFSANAPVVAANVCANTTGVTAEYVGHSAATTHDHDATGTTSTATTGSASPTPKSGAVSSYGSSAISTVVVGAAAVVVSYFL